MNIMGGNFSFKKDKLVLTHTSDIIDVAFDMLNNPHLREKRCDILQAMRKPRKKSVMHYRLRLASRESRGFSSG